MATKADFGEDEWRALQRGVTGAGMLVSVSDADFTDSFGEASALARFLGEQRRTNESELVREIAAVHGGGFGLTASREKVESETMAALRSAIATLSAKAPDEVAAYGQLVLDLAPGGGRGVGGSDRDGDEGDRQRSRGAPVQLRPAQRSPSTGDLLVISWGRGLGEPGTVDEFGEATLGRDGWFPGQAGIASGSAGRRSRLD